MTRNHVVREFIELVTDRIGAALEVSESVPEADAHAYDVLLVDDRGTLLEESMPLLEKLQECQRIVLYTQEHILHEAFDLKIKKPFLPSDIQSILEKKTATEEAQTGEQVLHIEDIEEIRSLLESEGMEIVSEEDLLDEIAAEEPAQRTETKTEITHSIMEEKLLEAVREMKPKKIRNLLKGAEVTLKISFPKEDR